MVWSEGFDDLLNGLVADGALLVDDLRALFAEAAMAAGDHDCVDLAGHAHLAVIVTTLVLRLHHLLRGTTLLPASHLGWIHHAVTPDRRQEALILLLVLSSLCLHHLSLGLSP